jgi:hypothetical protein
VSAPESTSAAMVLHDFMIERHWRGSGLVGPDPGVRLNYRVGRFVKSYLPGLPWRDDLYYLQAQAYWTLANWRLAEFTGSERSGEVATACARGMLERQRPDGAWDYPNREWHGRVANAEGSWAAIGLTETYRRTGEAAFADGALGWHRFLEREVGFVAARGGLAVNYFARRDGPPVPNNSAFVLRLLAELADVTGSDRFLARSPALLGFLAEAQRPSGELPYQLGTDGGSVRPHFQCTQYNAFQCLDLISYDRLTERGDARPIVEGLLRFLRGTVDGDGGLRFACDRRAPLVTYHAAAVAAALQEGARLGEPGCADAAASTLRALLALQRADGGFPHSRQNYGVLRDRRSYPRNLAMILHHLLLIADGAPSRSNHPELPQEP